jgi:hypothetical protein
MKQIVPPLLKVITKKQNGTQPLGLFKVLDRISGRLVIKCSNKNVDLNL